MWSWDADAFGVKAATAEAGVVQNLRFPGHEEGISGALLRPDARRGLCPSDDVATGLHYNHNRFYNPKLGRYMEPDPIKLEGGNNPYAYVGNDPVNNVDPSGLSFTIALGGFASETISFFSGNGFDWGNIGGAFLDGYDGQGQFNSRAGNFAWALGEDAITLASGGLGGIGAKGLANAAKFEPLSLAMPEMKVAKEADKWIRSPSSIQDKMALGAARNGAGARIIENLNDPKFKGMEKWEYKVKSSEGRDSVVHYVRDPKNGTLMDFKFKKRTSDNIGNYEGNPNGGSH